MAYYRDSFKVKVKIKVKVTLRLTVGQSACLGVEPKYGTFDQIYIYIFFLKLQSCHFWGALSDERSGLSCVSLCHCSLHYIYSCIYICVCTET
jgi:hypothetical protein